MEKDNCLESIMLYEEKDSTPAQQAASGVASKLVSEITPDDIPHLMDIFDEEVRKSAEDSQERIERAEAQSPASPGKKKSSSIKNSIIDDAVNYLRGIQANLSGDDSPLANPWEEIKEQVQNEPSFFWDAYLETMRQFIDGNVEMLSEEDRKVLAEELDLPPDDLVELCGMMMELLLDRAREEEIRYATFDFTHFRYTIEDFDVYARVLERTGLNSCIAMAYSDAIPDGESGNVNTDIIEDIMSSEEFARAEQLGWPEDWEEAQDVPEKEGNCDVLETILEDAINDLRDIAADLPDDDSPLSDPWEEIKDQVQHERAVSWPVYVETMEVCINGKVEALSKEDREVLAEELYAESDDSEELCEMVKQELLNKAGNEKINYEPFDFEYFRYSVKDFDIYCQILERTGMYQFRIAGYSVAISDGEEGEMSTRVIEDIMSKEEFNQARQMNWPEDWEEAKAGLADVSEPEADDLESIDQDNLLGQAEEEAQAESQSLIIVGGVSGGGKTTALKRIDLSEYVHIDAGRIMNQALRENAPVSHEESSSIAKEILKRATQEGYLVVYESQLTNFAAVDNAIDVVLLHRGYVHIAFIDIDAKTAVVRTKIAKGKGETEVDVPLDAIVKGFNHALPTFLELNKRYKDHPNVSFSLRNNDEDCVNPKLVLVNSLPICSQAPSIHQNTVMALEEALDSIYTSN